MEKKELSAEKTNLDWKDGDIMNTVDKEGKLHHFVLRDMMPEDTPEEWEKELRKRWYLWTYNKELDQYITCENEVIDFIQAELDRAREEGYQKGWEDGSKGKVFEKIEVETEVTFKDLRDVIEGKEDAGEFLSKLTTK